MSGLHLEPVPFLYPKGEPKYPIFKHELGRDRRAHPLTRLQSALQGTLDILERGDKRHVVLLDTPDSTRRLPLPRWPIAELATWLPPFLVPLVHEAARRTDRPRTARSETIRWFV